MTPNGKDDVVQPDSKSNTNNNNNNNNNIGNEKDLLGSTKTPAQRSIFQYFTGYEWQNFQSIGKFSQWLERPVDGSALGVFRMLYGAAMLIDIAEERGGSQMDVRFGEAQHCHFPLFDGIRAASFPVMGWLYLCMWLGALGIALGYRFRYSCLAFIVPYWYIFLLDKPAWNNHSYLFGLVGSLLLFTQANRYCSLDSYLQPSLPSTVPYWNYFLIKFQFFLLYMYAGLKKLTTEWLSGYAMTSLSRHWVFAPFRSVLTTEMIDLLVVHWFTAFFDFSIAFLMTCERTRASATPFMLSFHLMNSRLFVIGMFPWVCMAEVPLFFGFDWPRRLKAHLLQRQKKSTEITSIHLAGSAAPKPQPSVKSQARAVFILLYCVLQLFLPYSHFITKGYNNWTNGLYGYSWDMMVHTYDTILTSIKIVDNNDGHVHYLNPYAFTEYDRWTKYADMAVQYAKCIESNIRDDYKRNPRASPLSSPLNFSIYFDIWCSMNGRFQQRVFDPRVDLLQAEWSPFEATAWSMPLLDELNHMRPKLKTITNEVLNWNNYSDVIFVADFPGLTLDNFIAPELTNVTMTILEGNVRYHTDDDDNDETYFLTAGKSIGLSSGRTHHVTTIGQKPSCYLFTYINRTMLETETVLEEEHEKRYESKPKLPLWIEFRDRLSNYKKFLAHVGNCVLYTLYNVPIPLELRERD